MIVCLVRPPKQYDSVSVYALAETLPDVDDIELAHSVVRTAESPGATCCMPAVRLTYRPIATTVRVDSAAG